MKKSIIIVGLLVTVLGLVANSYIGYENIDCGLTDEELVYEYCQQMETYSFDRVVVNYESTDEDYINYTAFDGDRLSHSGCVNREYALGLLGE